MRRDCTQNVSLDPWLKNAHTEYDRVTERQFRDSKNKLNGMYILSCR